jgi:hypothetical protein
LTISQQPTKIYSLALYLTVLNSSIFSVYMGYNDYILFFGCLINRCLRLELALLLDFHQLFFKAYLAVNRFDMLQD